MAKTSFLGKMGSFFGLEDDEVFEEQAFTQPPRRSKPQATSVPKPQAASQANAAATNRTSQTKITVNPGASASAKSQVNRPSTTGRKPSKPEKKVVPMQSERSTTRSQNQANDSSNTIMVLEPRSYSEAMTIAKQIMSGKSVIVNFHLMQEPQARRIVDFLTGTVYAEDGDIKRVSNEMFLCTPKSVEIEGAAKSLMQNDMFDLNEMSL